MKKNFLKILVLAVISTLMISATACTYRAEGSVIQDVTFNVAYTDKAGEDVEIDAKIKLYKTFAPKTAEHIINLIKDGFYNNTAVAFDNLGDYLILGSYKLESDVYKDIMYNGETVNGEFQSNGFEGKLSPVAGTLVMLRDPDSQIGDAKYDTGKATFAILLDSSSALTSGKYTVFGKIDSDLLEKLQDMKEELFTDSDGYSKVRYVGDRDEETDKLIVENGAYKNSLEYYVKDGESYWSKNVKMQYEEEGDADFELYEKLADAHSFDNVILPVNAIKVSNFKLK